MPEYSGKNPPKTVTAALDYVAETSAMIIKDNVLHVQTQEDVESAVVALCGMVGILSDILRAVSIGLNVSELDPYTDLRRRNE